LFAAGIWALNKAHREKTHEYGIEAKQRPRAADAVHRGLLACFLPCHRLRLAKSVNVRNGS